MTPSGFGEQPSAPYLDAVVAYGFRGPGRFHVPGHKGGPGADPGLRHAIGEDVLALDVPQDIHGIDLGPLAPARNGHDRGEFVHQRRQTVLCEIQLLCGGRLQVGGRFCPGNGS